MSILNRIRVKIVTSSQEYQDVVRKNGELNEKLQKKQEDINKTNRYWKHRIYMLTTGKNRNPRK